MENVLCRSNVEPIESQGIWYTIAIVLLGVPSNVVVLCRDVSDHVCDVVREECREL